MCYFELQKQSIMVRQLEEELRMRMRGPSVEMQQQMEVLYNENEHLTREIAILRDTIKVNCCLDVIDYFQMHIFQCTASNNFFYCMVQSYFLYNDGAIIQRFPHS